MLELVEWISALLAALAYVGSLTIVARWGFRDVNAERRKHTVNWTGEPVINPH